MRVLFDHQTFREQRYGGVSLYMSRLMDGINRLDHGRVQLTISNLNNENLKALNLDDVYINRMLWRMMPRKGRRFSNAFSLYSMSVKSYDVFHPTYYDPYFLKAIPKHKPWTFTYHDLTHERLGDYYPDLKSQTALMQNKEKLVRTAPAMIAISETTKQDMVDYYQVDPDLISVVYHGNPYELVNKVAVTEKLFEFPYLLFVGNRWSYKNFPFLVQAVGQLLKKHSIHLVCAGGGAFTSEEVDLFNQHGISEFVHYQGITNESLPNLYRQAVAFVFPSLYEGFGFPVLEAFSCQCPCLLSNAGSLPEIAGADAAIYFDPKEDASLTVAVEKLIGLNEAERSQLINNGLNRLSAFTWDKTIEETVKVYRKLLNT